MGLDWIICYFEDGEVKSSDIFRGKWTAYFLYTLQEHKIIDVNIADDCYGQEEYTIKIKESNGDIKEITEDWVIEDSVRQNIIMVLQSITDNDIKKLEENDSVWDEKNIRECINKSCEYLKQIDTIENSWIYCWW